MFLEWIPSHGDHGFRDAWTKAMVCMFMRLHVCQGDRGPGCSFSLPLTDKEAEPQSHIPSRSCSDLRVSWPGLEPRPPESGSQVLNHTAGGPS